MTSFHPDSRFLTDFAAGTLPVSQALCVSAHLHFCGKCRMRVQRLTDVGCELFTSLEPEAPDPDVEQASFEAIMQRIDAGESEPETEAVAKPSTPVAEDAFVARLPSALQKLVGPGLARMSWAQFGKSLRIAPLDIGDAQRETALYDISAGGRMPEHEHRGEEITVLLKGSFSDADGKYSQGDFVVRNVGEAHQPTASQDTDCICLVSVERPVRACSIWYRLLEPLVRYRLARTAN